MSVAPQSVGRRERNKQDKLDRITAAARELFSEHGVDDVTTQQIADKADIGTGTLFLYAKTKAELLLLVQNSGYADALVEGKTAAEAIPDVFEAVMAIVRPVVECNRKQIDNREALTLTVQTEEAIADVLRRDPGVEPKDAAMLAHMVSAIMFLSMAATINISRSVDEVLSEISEHVGVLFPRQ
jgi:AcrR family transcriptional regulator